MPIISFGFTKISGERKEQKSGQLNIKNGIVLKDAIKTKFTIGPQSQDVLRVLFEFTSKYDPNRGSITLEGEVLHLDKPEKIEALAKAWQKEKKLPKDDARVFINHILSKCNIEAILLSRELNLPSPIELPRIST